MAKTYSTPNPKPEEQGSEKQKDTQREKTVGVYDRPQRRGPSRAVIIAIALAVIIALIILFLGLARGRSGVSTSVEYRATDYTDNKTATTQVVAVSFPIIGVAISGTPPP